MYRIILIPVLLMLANCSSAPTTPIAGLLEKLDDEKSSEIMVVAHRACWSATAPENSLAGVRDCIELGVDMIEIDVAVTKDGVVVLLHDESIDRTTTGTGLISELDYVDLNSVYLRQGKGGDGAPISKEKIPTLEQVLELARGKVLINLDVKGPAFSQAFEVVEKVKVNNQILMKMGVEPQSPELKNALFRGKTMFMPIIRQCVPEKKIQNCTLDLGNYVSGYDEYDPIAYEITYVDEPFFAAGVSSMKNKGERIWVNTLSPHHAAGIIDQNAVNNPAETWGHIIALGANIIQTDNPRELIEYLKGAE